MPKAKRVVGAKGSKVKVSNRKKFKLGNRKVARSANETSTKELEAFITSSAGRPRDKAKARAVLARRPKPTAPVEQAAPETAEVVAA